MGEIINAKQMDDFRKVLQPILNLETIYLPQHGD